MVQRTATAAAMLVSGFMMASAHAGLIFSGFEGTSQLANCALGQCFRPPDTMGAVGTTQYLETTNGSITVYNKNTGAVLSRVDAPSFWVAAGLPRGAGGDQRVLFDHYTNRWIMNGFGLTGNLINIGISDTADALGSWKSTQIVGVPGKTLDYPTLGLTDKAVTIGTNNFSPGFSGTSMFTIPKADLFGGAPTLANMTRFDHAWVSGVAAYGFAMQGAVNFEGSVGNTVPVLASSVVDYKLKFHTLSGVNAAGATQSAAQDVVVTLYDDPGPARQPDGTRLVDTLFDRISANVYQHNGRLYAVHTETPTGTDHTAVAWKVIDAATGALIDEGLISNPNYDYYQGSIAVNSLGQAVIGYNRSGFQTGDSNGDGKPDGRISFLGRAFLVDGSGGLDEYGDEMLFRVSETDDYRCGLRTVIDTVCRQRWGDYSAVTIDPDNESRFFAIGEYAAEWAVIPGLTTTERAIWHTYVAEVTFVPEPGSMALIAVSLLALTVNRRRRLH